MMLTRTKSVLFSVLTSAATMTSFVFANPGKIADPGKMIVGGDDAVPGDYPYFVDMGGCGGALIAPDIVLSAAHCGSFKDEQLNIGAYMTGTTAEGSQGRFCDEWRADPNFGTGGDLNYDFALCKLNEPVNIDSNIELKLNELDSCPKEGKNLVVMGFGALQEGGFGSAILQDVTVPVISNDECSEYYSDSITENMLCAGFKEGGKDSCQGDSGGPIIRRKKNDDGTITDLHVGVVSWGIGCAQENKPGVYARTSKRTDWIKDTACDMGSIADFCEHDTPSCDHDLTITLNTDKYASETSWTLKDSENNEVMRRKYQIEYYKNEHKLCVKSNECYELTIEDSYGDGLCTEGACESYSVGLDGEEILSEIGDFSYYRTVEICTGEGSDCEDDESFEYNDNSKKTCEKWVGEGTKKEIKKKCKKEWQDGKVYDWCPKTCGEVGLGQCSN